MEAPTHCEALNRRFGIRGVARIVPGHGGLPFVQIASAAAMAEISMYGAQVLRWRPTGAEDVLFLSRKSHWEPGQPIRGGIPVCFPWFRNKADNPAAPKHGFVRTKEWRLDSLRADDDGSVTLVCLTASDPDTRSLWPHDFLLAYRIRVADTLRLELSVMNRGAIPLRFEEALHTYFSVGSVRKSRVLGLSGATYLDNTDDNKPKTQQGDLVLTRQTDNAYMGAAGAAEIVDSARHRRLVTQKHHSATTVVWNPWQQGAANLADLAADEWEKMLCVEASNILADAVTLAPGEEHMMRATISVLPEG